jgi:hypothetical protein
VLLAGGVILLAAASAIVLHYRPAGPARYAPVEQPAAPAWPETATMPGPGTDPLAGVMERLASPPAGSIAPGGATWISAYRHGGGVVVTYLDGEPLEAVERFYRSELPARGFKLMREAASRPAGPVAMVFLHQRQSMVVQLRVDPDSNVRIVLVIETSSD